MEIVWDNQVWEQPWVFNQEADTYYLTCTNQECIQRLWCTDTGVVGRYGGGISTDKLPLSFVWLKNTLVGANLTLVAEYKNGSKNVSLPKSNMYGPATLTVVGDTLYFFAYNPATANSLPHLSSIVFKEYEEGKSVSTLYRKALNGYNVLGYNSSLNWAGAAMSPIYPSSGDSVTISTAVYNSYDGDGTWMGVIDSVVSQSYNEDAYVYVGSVRVRVHTTNDLMPSAGTASREFITTPGYACRTFTDGTLPLCYRLTENQAYSWSGDTKLLSIDFKAFTDEPHFSLPQALDLHLAAEYTTPFYVLAGYGYGSVIAFHEDRFYGVEHVTDESCPDGRSVLASYAVTDDGLSERREDVNFGCAEQEELPQAYYLEPSYAATTVKWVGPYVDDFALFVSRGVADHVYCPADKHYSCGPGQIFDGECLCLACERGHWCDGKEQHDCQPGTYSDPGAAACTECAPGSYGDADGAFSCKQCPAGTFATAPGASACTPCPAGHFGTEEGSSQELDCHACPEGQYQPGKGATGCAQCMPGHFPSLSTDAGSQPTDSGATACVECPAGSICDGLTKKPCASGFFTEATGQVECQLCPAGSVCDGPSPPAKCDLSLGKGAARCESCGQGNVWYNGVCIACSSLPSGVHCATRKGISTTYEGLQHSVLAGIITGSVVAAIAIALGIAIPLFIRRNHSEYKRLQQQISTVTSINGYVVLEQSVAAVQPRPLV